MNISTLCDASNLWDHIMRGFAPVGQQQLRLLFLPFCDASPSGKPCVRRAVRHVRRSIPCGLFDFAAGSATCVTLHPHVGHSFAPRFDAPCPSFRFPRGSTQYLYVVQHTSAPCLHGLERAARSLNAGGEKWRARPGCGGARGENMRRWGALSAPRAYTTVEKKNSEPHSHPSPSVRRTRCTVR